MVIALLIAVTGCKKNADEQPQHHQPAPPPENKVTGGKYPLNVIYFIPSDLDTVPGFQRRLNGVFNYTQRFISQWMTKWGYIGTTISLPADSTGNLKLIVLRGQQGKDAYPYSGGAGNVMNEVNAYYSAHPTEKTSEHILVIMPAYSYRADGYPSGGPFYGIGRWCFALDYPGLDTINFGKPDDKFATIWIGGMAHELGHGINLPHNGGAQSQNLLYGTTLMGSGNSTYGKAPTYLSPADAAILANCQVFSKATRSDWYGNASGVISKIYAGYNKDSAAIIVSGKFSAGVPVKDIAYYNRNTDSDVGGYRSVTFASKPLGTDSFYIKMPMKDFRDTANTNYEFVIRLCHENGTITTYTASYSFVNNVPVIGFGDKIVYDKKDWRVISFSSEETASENGAAANVIDGANNTYWHSRWSTSGAGYPHTLVIDMAKILYVNRFTFRQRESRRVKTVEILISNNNSTWTSLGDFTLQDHSNPQNITFPTLKYFRYFKLNMKSAYDGLQFAAMSEVGTYKD